MAIIFDVTNLSAEERQELLDLIYGSRTWKLHNAVQKLKGRG